MRKGGAAVLISFLMGGAASADPPVECPNVILTFRDNGHNSGRYYLCKGVHIGSEPPHYIICDINDEQYYDVGEYRSDTNKWWVYSPEAEQFDNLFVDPDGSCDTSSTYGSKPRRR